MYNTYSEKLSMWLANEITCNNATCLLISKLYIYLHLLLSYTVFNLFNPTPEWPQDISSSYVVLRYHFNF